MFPESSTRADFSPEKEKKEQEEKKTVVNHVCRSKQDMRRSCCTGKGAGMQGMDDRKLASQEARENCCSHFISNILNYSIDSVRFDATRRSGSVVSTRTTT